MITAKFLKYTASTSDTGKESTRRASEIHLSIIDLNMKTIIALIVTLMISATAYAQTLPQLSMRTGDRESISETFSFGDFVLAAFPLNPILMIEGDKFYVGITKEVSFGSFPYGRVAAEYSLIFRETRVSHLRFSYNYDIPLEAGDLAALLLSVGGGYFTDFDKEGYFPQVYLGLLFPVAENIGANPYIKLRHTFMTESDKSDISDLSFGLSLYIGF